MREMKFNTGGSEELSRKIQERLFEMGYKWIAGEVVKYQEYHYIYTYKDGSLGWGSIAQAFNNSYKQLTTLEDISKPQRGDRVLVWDSDKSEERIYVAEIEGSVFPHVCVNYAYEDEFLNGQPFTIMQYKNMELLPNKLTELEKQYKKIGEEIAKLKK